jgi:membrane fusion protein (multidrug efflux system)
MSLRKRFSPLVIGLLLLTGLLAYLNWPEAQQVSKSTRQPTPVSAIVAQQVNFPITIEALGTANANESVSLTAQQSDIVTKVMFEDGDQVRKGQLLVQLNNVEEMARVNELEVNLAEAKRQLVRINDLARTSAASEQLLDAQQALVAALESQMAVARAQLNELEIRAPFAGRLGIRQISVGALVRPADVITTLDDTSVVKVNFNVAENHLASLAIGQKITATSVAYPGESFIGEIKAIDSRIDPVTRAILIRATIDNQDGRLRPGMLLQITLEKAILQTIVIPEKSLVPNREKQFVFVVKDNKVEKREVMIGERRPGKVQIVSGLAIGDVVVTEGTLRIQNGSAVSVINLDGKGV